MGLYKTTLHMQSNNITTVLSIR